MINDKSYLSIVMNIVNDHKVEIVAESSDGV